MRLRGEPSVADVLVFDVESVIWEIPKVFSVKLAKDHMGRFKHRERQRPAVEDPNPAGNDRKHAPGALRAFGRSTYAVTGWYCVRSAPTVPGGSSPRRPVNSLTFTSAVNDSRRCRCSSRCRCSKSGPRALQYYTETVAVEHRRPDGRIRRVTACRHCGRAWQGAFCMRPRPACGGAGCIRQAIAGPRAQSRSA